MHTVLKWSVVDLVSSMQRNLNYIVLSTQVFNLCTDTLAGLHILGIPQGCMLMRQPETPAETLSWRVNTKLTLIISVNCSFISVKKWWLIYYTLKGSENNCSIQPNRLRFSMVCCGGSYEKSPISTELKLNTTLFNLRPFLLGKPPHFLN